MMQHELTENQGFGYLGNMQVKQDGVEQSFTADQISEYARCMDDPAYFARNYIKVINIDLGLIPFDLYPYQEKMFKHFQQNRFSLVLACRQSGKSISVAIYILWYAIFHPNRTVAILANKGATAREIFGRVTLALEHLPFFLQPGCKELNKGSVKFSNESRIIASATSGTSIRGMSINLLYLDEFAFVENSDTFYTSTYPVISSGKNSQVIITSTMNGVANLFYRLWEGAQQGVNEYKPFRVDWFDVPGRDQAWKTQTIANTSQLQFDQEFGNTALGGNSNLLISSAGLLSMQTRAPLRYKSITRDKDTRIYLEPEPNHRYFVLVDVAKGCGQDYSTATVIDVTAAGMFYQVCTYRNNLVSLLILPDIIVNIAKMYNNATLVIENNSCGQVVCNAVHYELEYENIFLESGIGKDGIGVNMTRKIKRIGCSNLKDLIESGKLAIYDSDTITELSTFESNSSGSYEASQGNHDDLVMNLVLFSWFISTPAAEMNDGDINLRQMLYRDQIRAMEEDVSFVGLFPESNLGRLSASENARADMIAQAKEWQF